MKKKKIVITLLMALVCCSIFLCVTLLKQRKIEKRNQEYLNQLSNNLYVKSLCISGDFTYDGKKVYVSNLEKNQNDLMIKIALYNYYHDDKKVTSDLLFNEYNEFCNGKDYHDCDVLEKYACWHDENEVLNKKVHTAIVLYFYDKNMVVEEANSKEMQVAIEQALSQL